MTTLDNLHDGTALKRDIWTVTRLNREVRAVLEGSFPPLWVQGEISNLARPASGHIYFSLKDSASQVRCAMFKGRNRALKFAPENGMEVIIRANVGLYEGRGEYQLIVEAMEPAGAGALQQAFEQLKAKLQQEGLFDADRKKPLPPCPDAIGIITSPSGAAIRDILTVLQRRYPRAVLIIYPVAVQGEGSAEQIVRALQTANERNECDLLLLSRGGGSLEDLWSFNEEVVARAIAASTLPVVTGVGHEIDFTIADFVADQRAPTPSAAAELVSPDSRELGNSLDSMVAKLGRTITQLTTGYRQLLLQLEKRLPHPASRLQNLAQRNDDLSIRLFQSLQQQLIRKQSLLNRGSGELKQHNPLQRLAASRQRCDHLGRQLQTQLRTFLVTARERVNHLARNLNTVSPLATLERGYAIVSDSGGRIVREASAVKKGETINTRLGKGRLTSVVTASKSEKK